MSELSLIVGKRHPIGGEMLLGRVEVSRCRKVCTENVWIVREMRIRRNPGAYVSRPVCMVLETWKDATFLAHWQKSTGLQLLSSYFPRRKLVPVVYEFRCP